MKAVLLLTFALLLPATAGANKPDKDLAKARQLVDKGRYEKAAVAFEKAAAASEDGCLPCRVEQLQALLQGGLYADAAPVLRKILELSTAAPNPDAIAQTTAAFRTGLANGDLDALDGLFAVLSYQGEHGEIASLAMRHLAGQDLATRSLVCAAESRPVLVPKAKDPPIAGLLNAELRKQGWKGPFLFTRDMLPPKPVTKTYQTNPEEGIRLAGAVDLKGRIHGVRLMTPGPEKEVKDATKKVRSAYFDAATLRGRRLEVCLPASVGEKRRPKNDKSYEIEPVGVFAALARLETTEEVLNLVKIAGPDAPQESRDAICAVTKSKAALNRELLAIGWPGPFLDANDVDDPEPISTPLPEYTEEAEKAEAIGIIKAMAVVDENGKVRSVVPLRGLPGGMTVAAVEMMKTWEFTPVTYKDKTVAVCLELEIELPPPDPDEPKKDDE